MEPTLPLIDAEPGDASETAPHPPHAERPTAARRRAHAVRARLGRVGRGPVVALVLIAAFGLSAAGCLAPQGAPAGAPPAVANAIQGAFGDAGPGVVSCMTSIAGRESGWNPGARNGSGASGLFQLMLPLHNDLFWALGVDPNAAWGDPNWNARAARELWNSSGTAPWGGC